MRGDMRVERREGRMEIRDKRGYHSPQRRRSREQSLGRPVRSFEGFAGGGMSSVTRKKHLRNARVVSHVFKKEKFATNVVY